MPRALRCCFRLPKFTSSREGSLCGMFEERGVLMILTGALLRSRVSMRYNRSDSSRVK